MVGRKKKKRKKERKKKKEKETLNEKVVRKQRKNLMVPETI